MVSPEGEHVEGLLVIQRYAAQVQCHAASFRHRVADVGQDGEIGEAEEVHLEQAKLGYGIHWELGHGHVFRRVPAHGTLQREILDERLLGDDHAGGVSAGMAHQSLELLRLVHKIL